MVVDMGFEYTVGDVNEFGMCIKLDDDVDIVDVVERRERKERRADWEMEGT